VGKKINLRDALVADRAPLRVPPAWLALPAAGTSYCS